MKRYLIIPLLLLLSCSKKSHLLNQLQTSTHFTSTKDSSGAKNQFSVDKSVITSTIDLDTMITVKSRQLSGALNTADSVKHFENDDLNIDFQQDQSGSSFSFIIKPKVKPVHVQYHYKTITQNNITQSENSKSASLVKSTFLKDSINKQVYDKRDAVISPDNIKSVIICVIVLMILATACFVVLKRKFF